MTKEHSFQVNGVFGLLFMLVVILGFVDAIIRLVEALF